MFSRFQLSLRTLFVALNALSIGSFLVLLYFNQSILTGLKSSIHATRLLAGMVEDIRAIQELANDIEKPDGERNILPLMTRVDEVSDRVSKSLSTYPDLMRLQVPVVNVRSAAEAYSKTKNLEPIKSAITQVYDEFLTARTRLIGRLDQRADLLSTLMLRVVILVIAIIVFLSFFGHKVGKAEEMLKKQQERVASSARMSALGEMAGGVSHEINNPLGFILGYTEQVENLVSKDTVDKTRILSKTKIIKETCHRIANIIRGLKMMSRDGSKDPFEPVSLYKIVEDAKALCEMNLKKSDIEFRVEPIPENLFVNCREVQIGQVLLNLINNARDAIEKFPERWISLEVKEAGKFIEIAVTDCGNGIPKEIQDKVLDPFFTTKAAGTGTGLGLSISRAIALEHRGDLKLDKTSKNTRFIFTLRRAKGAENSEEPTSSDSENPSAAA